MCRETLLNFCRNSIYDISEALENILLEFCGFYEYDVKKIFHQVNYFFIFKNH